MGTFAAGIVLNRHTLRPVAGVTLQVRDFTTAALLTPDGGQVTTGAVSGGYDRFVVPGVDSVTLVAPDGTLVDLVSVEALSRSGTSVTSIAGSVDTAANLPASAPEDVAYVAQDTKHLWAWNGTGWVDLGTVQGPAGSDASVTPANVAAVVDSPEVLGALTDNGARPVGRGELVVNVKDHGATGDGTTDDSVAILAARQEAVDTGIRHLHFPPGTYRLGATLELSGFMVSGGGTPSTIVKATNGFTGTMFRLDTAANMSHLQVDGNGVATRLVHLNGSARTILHALYLHSANGHGLWFTGTGTSDSSHMGVISDINIINCSGYGIFLNSWAYDNRLVNVWIGTCGTGIRDEGGACQYTALHIWGCTGNGLEIRSNYTRIVNAYLETNGGNGLDASSVRGLVASGLDCWKNGSSGVNFYNTRDWSVSGSLLRDNGVAGVLLSGSGTLAGIIDGNNFFDAQTTKTQDYGVRANAGVSDVLVTGNVIRAADHVVTGMSNNSGGSSILVRSNIGAADSA